MNKTLQTIKENQTTILIGAVTILTGVVLFQHGVIRFQKNMFNQMASSIEDLGLGEPVLTYMKEAPVHPWI